MDRPGLTLALAAALCAGCGEREALRATPEPPAASAPAAELAPAIARAQARLARAPEILKVLDPSSGETDFDEAARRLARAAGECRADQRVFSEVADRLADEHPDARRAPPAVALARARAAAFRFREWVLLELLKATARAVDELRARGRPGPAEALLALSQLETIVYPHEGVAMLRRWLEVAPEALRRARGEDLAEQLRDQRMIAFAWGPGQWSAKDAADARAHVAAFRAAAGTLAPPLPAVVARWWDWGEKHGGAPLDASISREQAKDLRALGLESLAVEVEQTAAR